MPFLRNSIDRYIISLVAGSSLLSIINTMGTGDNNGRRYGESRKIALYFFRPVFRSPNGLQKSYRVLTNLSLFFRRL